MQNQRLEIVRQELVSTARSIVAELDFGDSSLTLKRIWAQAGMKEARILRNPGPADINDQTVRRIYATLDAAGALAPGGLRQTAFKPETLGADLRYFNIVDPVPDGDFRFAIYGDGVAVKSTAKLQSGRMSDLAMRPQSGPGPAFFLASYMLVLRHNCAVYTRNDTLPWIPVARWERLMVPLWGPGGEARILSAVVGVGERIPGRAPAGWSPPPSRSSSF
jgi:hypothetical protein